jgi:hypothetical protein
MRLRGLIQRSRWAQAGCLALLVIFVLICGVHLFGVQHDSEADGLGFGDGLAVMALGAALGMALVAGRRRWGSAPPACHIVLRPAAEAAVPKPPVGMVVPLRR